MNGTRWDTRGTHKETKKKREKKRNGREWHSYNSLAYSAERILNYVTVNNDHRRMVESLNLSIITNWNRCTILSWRQNNKIKPRIEKHNMSNCLGMVRMKIISNEKWTDNCNNNSRVVWSVRVCLCVCVSVDDIFKRDKCIILLRK